LGVYRQPITADFNAPGVLWSAYPFARPKCHSRRLGTDYRKPITLGDYAPNLSPSLTRPLSRRAIMNTSTFKESILDQVAITAAIVVAALMTLSQIASLF
jgi:hypothetical protein